AARAQIVARSDEDRTDFLRKRGFSKADTARIIETVLVEEGHPPASVLCDLSCQMPVTPEGWRRKAREGRSASRREDPIHLGAATRQRGGSIRRAERRGQWAEAWKPRSGSALAETGRLSASERPSKVRNRKTGPRGWWPGPKGQRVGSPDGTTGDGDTNSRRTRGRSRPGRISPSGNRVSPTRPVARRKPDRKGG